ncbi:Retrovirus-related Pol polyprotein from transposon opus [Ceratobasidium sp. AG-Ba]|nr:Retrovirus-related Pol polyprotein from transposon opus [Ceratobasidium sp. AG-Ba]
MANGVCVPSKGTGAGVIRLEETSWPIRFEVIDSKGAFELLLGKDWLRHAGAKQIFATDSLSLCTPAGRIELRNSNPLKRRPAGPRPLSEKPNQEAELEEPERRVESSDESPGEPVPRRSLRLKARDYPNANPFWVAESALLELRDAVVEEAVDEPVVESDETLWQRARAEAEEETMRSVLMTEPTEMRVQVDRMSEVARARARRMAERERGPVDIAIIASLDKPRERRPRLLQCPTQTDVQTLSSRAESQKYYARSRLAPASVESSGRESNPWSVKMKLDIPEDATFPKRVGQRKFSEPQRQALYAMLDELEDAKIIERVTQDQEGQSDPDIKTLQRMANSECRKYGFEVKYPGAGFYEDSEEKRSTQPAKWRLVQNFAAVNKVTQIRPFPMGDLAAKQRAVAGHKFVSVMDLQAGFHAIPIARESIPYTGFYVEGRGHYVYLRMPFGLTGAPTTFCEMVATAFHGLIGKILGFGWTTWRPRQMISRMDW